MEAEMVSSREQVEALKQNWKEDPCWDIETTEGFDEYSSELLAFRRQCEAKWDEKVARRQEQKRVHRYENMRLSIEGGHDYFENGRNEDANSRFLNVIASALVDIAETLDCQIKYKVSGE